jgi:hypothetical protein
VADPGCRLVATVVGGDIGEGDDGVFASCGAGPGTAPSVVSRYYPVIDSRATRPRRTFSRISSAVAVHTNGLGSLLFASR